MIPGYATEAEIYRGSKRIVYQARRTQDAAQVIIKTLVDEFPSPAETAGLRREYDILRELDIDGVARALDFVVHRDRPALVLEGARGRTLKGQIPPDGFPLETFFEIALPLARTLGRLHERGIVHKDLNPNNALYDATSSRVTLIDFGIATRLPPVPAPLRSPRLLEGTIAYMSPEQSGRMNRDVDDRTDFYSLGASFYELLTGRILCDSPDPLEVIHAHIAKTPPSPHELNAHIPVRLSDLVMKLLAKSAEDRYQSARGLEADLRNARDEWSRTGRIENLVLGQDDVRERFSIPQRLYGRESEVAALVGGFDRVCGGANELVLVSGYSGIGKTVLVHELHKLLAGRRAVFATGKFDQLGRDVPYVALIVALRAAVRHWLAEPEARLRQWEERLKTALGGNARLVTDVIPELENLLGPQPEVPPLDPTEAQNRFNRTMQRFVGAMARPEHPLVLFVDDLQWADLATLSLLPLLLDAEGCKGLLFVGAYRDREVSASHPLRATLSEVANRGIRLQEIALSPLARDSLQAFIADTLQSEASAAGEVTALVEAKTGGNPFFVTQFLRTLHQDGFIVLEGAGRGWKADLTAIRRANMTDNVVDLMSGKIQRLGLRTRDALRLAACVGNRFDLATLATIAERTPAEVANDLWEAVQSGLIMLETQTEFFGPDLDPQLDASQIHLRFLHDRVQQAAYEQIPESARHTVHLQVGRLLLARSATDVPEEIFEIVNHINLGRRGIDDHAEQLRLAALNLEAGRKARASGAYASAVVYFAIGASLIREEDWAHEHALAFSLHLERCEGDYLCGRFAEAESGLLALLSRCRSPLDSAEVYMRMVAVCETMSRYDDAITAAVSGLEALGVEVPGTPESLDTVLREDLLEIEALRAGRPLGALLDLPRLSDPVRHRAMRLLMAIWAPAYISGRTSLRCFAAARMVRLSLEHGNCEESAFGYLHHGITVGFTLGDYQLGYEFGKLALALNERLADLRLHAAVHHRFAALVNLWTRPFETCIEHARLAVRSGIESGHLQVAAYALFQQSWYAMLREPDLEQFERRCLPSIEELSRLKSPAFLQAQRLILQWGYALQGKTASPTELTASDFDEAEFGRTVGRSGIFRALHATVRLELLDTFQKVPEAYQLALEEEKNAEIFASAIWPAMFAFRHVLALCAWLSQAPEEERAAASARLEGLEARLAQWAANAPENFAHWHRLACAEIARVRGRAGEAMEHYESAIALAERQKSPRHRALANELYGRFWLMRGQPRFARVLLREARFGYAQWGATAKVADLEQRYADLLAEPPGAPATTRNLPASLTTTVGRSTSLDALALARAARTLSGEIELPALLEALLRIVLQSAGARRACLILDRQGQWQVEAEGTVEPEKTVVLQGIPLEETRTLPHSILNFVARSGESVVLEDAASDPDHSGDPYVVRARPRSVLCTGISHQNRRIGLLYLENDLARAVFTPERVEMMQLLSSQAAIAIQNAELFAEVNRLNERVRAENVYLLEEIKTRQGFEEIVGRSTVLKKVLNQVEQVAETDSTVLICGETGTGKELLARAIHRLSRRRNRPLVTINCGAISPGLVESELFGHEKGAFTGALSRKIGRFELADGGTIFLDEIGDLAPELQVKLLRVLQEGEIDRVGGSKLIPVDVRVVAATHRDLEVEVREGRFREDLFYRLNVFPIRTPALRERPEDIPLLVRYFAIQHGLKLGKKIESIPKKILDALTAYAWPGNIRELSNLVERSVIISSGPVLELRDWAPGQGRSSAATISRSLSELEKEHILSTLERTKWKVSGPQGAAQILGLKPTTLEARMKRLGIQRPR